jgi:hypothetical protein
MVLIIHHDDDGTILIFCLFFKFYIMLLYKFLTHLETYILYIYRLLGSNGPPGMKLSIVKLETIIGH